MKIFILIERRADYSRYKPILELISKDPFFDLYLVVTGVCLLDLHGKDINYIEKDGFKIDSKIEMFENNSPDNGAEMVKSLSRVMHKVTIELEKSKPDLVLSGFDIGGNLAVTIAAAHMNIPVAHIQGGEVTGSIDESIRHAMSKFSHFHFPATEDAANRLIRLGENPKNIYVVGCPSIDVIKNTEFVEKEYLAKKFNIDFKKPLLIFIQHPVTTENNNSENQIKESIEALEKVNANIIALLPNNDAGFSKIIKEISSSKIKWYPSLSTVDFINLYRNASAIVGNSSSGIHEAASFKIPAVNIGNRQMGRERACNVIDVKNDTNDILYGINKALYDKQFLNSLNNLINPYGKGNSAEKIIQILKNLNLKEFNPQKEFYE